MHPEACSRDHDRLKAGKDAQTFYWAHSRLAAVTQRRQRTFYEVGDVLEGPRLLAVAEDGERLARQRL